jgi:hypothetical protein
MFASVENLSIKHEEASLPESTKPHQEVANEAGSLKNLKIQQYSLENQIEDLCAKLSFDKSTNLDKVQKQPLQHQIKFLAVKLSLNTAEQKALEGEDVKNILQPIDAMLIENKPTFPLDTEWLKEKINYIRRLAPTLKNSL